MRPGRVPSELGGKIVPEHWMNLPGMDKLYANATPGGDCKPRPCKLSTCDLAVTGPDAGARMLKYLDTSITESIAEHPFMGVLMTHSDATNFAESVLHNFNLLGVPCKNERRLTQVLKTMHVSTGA